MKSLWQAAVALFLVGCAGGGASHGTPEDPPAGISVWLIPWRSDKDGFFMPSDDATSASIMIPTKGDETLKTLEVVSLDPSAAVLMTATKFNTVHDGAFNQVDLSIDDLPPGGIITPSKAQDAIDGLRRGDNFLRATFKNGENDDPEKAIAGDFKGAIPGTQSVSPVAIGATGTTVTFNSSSPGSFKFRLPDASFDISFHVIVSGPSESTLPEISRVDLVSGQQVSDVALQLKRDAMDQSMFSATGSSGVMSDSDPRFRPIRQFAFAAMTNSLQIRLKFTGISNPVYLPLHLSKPLP